jgi:ABC-type Zn uptake system ZnuABC Zn-binding protein ZnuA
MILRFKTGYSPFPILAAGLLLALAALSACRPAAVPPTPAAVENQDFKVVATTTILADVVRQVGGSAFQVTVLLPAGSDPHTFEPTPRDLAALAEADLVFINGAGLEEFLDSLLENAAAEAGAAKIISASDGIQLRQMEEEHSGEAEEEPEEHTGTDPHVWFDPQNVAIWTRNIERELSEADPANAGAYAANAEAYRAALEELDEWIEAQVAQIPTADRKLVTDHETFGYFAARYGFEQVGAVIPGSSIASAPSAQALADLEDRIQELGVRAIFVGSTVNPDLAQRIADDTGVQLVPLYTDSLTAPGSEASSYLELMRYDVNAIVAALKE